MVWFLSVLFFLEWTRVNPFDLFSIIERHGDTIHTSTFWIQNLDPSACKFDNDGLWNVSHGWLLPVNKSFSSARPNPWSPPPPINNRSLSHNCTYEFANEYVYTSKLRCCLWRRSAVLFFFASRLLLVAVVQRKLCPPPYHCLFDRRQDCVTKAPYIFWNVYYNFMLSMMSIKNIISTL